jgi:hypothetical protein
MTYLTLIRKIKHLSGNAVTKSKKNFSFYNMCNTCSRIRMRIGIVLMPIRIRIGIGINMEIRIRIHNTAFFKRTGTEGPCPQHPSMKLNLSQPSLVSIQYVQTSKRPVTRTKTDFTSLKDFHPLHVGADLNQISHGKL